MRARISTMLALSATLSACLALDPPEGALVCSSNAECPPGWECRTDGRCYRPRVAIDAGRDAGPLRDGGRRDACVGCDAGEFDAGELVDAGEIDAGFGIDSGPPSDAGEPGTPTAFVATSFEIRDPHFFAPLFCLDVTDMVNDALNGAISTDADSDGYYDLGIGFVLRPHDPSRSAVPFTLMALDCMGSPPLNCVDAGESRSDGVASNNLAGPCGAPVPGTTTAAYSPALTVPVPPCFIAPELELVVTISGVPIMLHDVEVSATYDDASGRLANGLLRGFYLESDANSQIFPPGTPVVEGHPVSSVLPGGSGDCSGTSDLDMHEGVAGWWFYANFAAQPADYVGP